jgi:hypothetical protein
MLKAFSPFHIIVIPIQLHFLTDSFSKSGFIQRTIKKNGKDIWKGCVQEELRINI